MGICVLGRSDRLRERLGVKEAIVLKTSDQRRDRVRGESLHAQNVSAVYYMRESKLAILT